MMNKKQPLSILTELSKNESSETIYALKEYVYILIPNIYNLKLFTKSYIKKKLNSLGRGSKYSFHTRSKRRLILVKIIPSNGTCLKTFKQNLKVRVFKTWGLVFFQRRVRNPSLFPFFFENFRNQSEIW